MIPAGTLLNISLVILGGTLGLFLKKNISSKLNNKIFYLLGLFTIFLGFGMSIKQQNNYILILLSLVFGSLTGEYLSLDLRIVKASGRIKSFLGIKDKNFTEGMITAFLLYCVGSMAIVGSIDEGMGREPNILYVKSIMDGISSIILASTLGVGVLFSVIPMFLFQAGITYLTFFFQDSIPLELIDQINVLGGLIIVSIGMKILGYKHINTNNLIPSFIFIIIFYFVEKYCLF